MTSVRGRRRPRQERSSATPSVASSITPPDFFSPPDSGDKLFDQAAWPSRAKPLANVPPAATSVPKYSEDDLHQIFKAILEA